MAKNPSSSLNNSGSESDQAASSATSPATATSATSPAAATSATGPTTATSATSPAAATSATSPAAATSATSPAAPARKRGKAIVFGVLSALVCLLIGLASWSISNFCVTAVYIDGIALGTQMAPPAVFLAHYSQPTPSATATPATASTTSVEATQPTANATSSTEAAQPTANATSSTEATPATPSATSSTESAQPTASATSSTEATPATPSATSSTESAQPTASATSSTEATPATPSATSSTEAAQPTAPVANANAAQAATVDPQTSAPGAPSTPKQPATRITKTGNPSPEITVAYRGLPTQAITVTIDSIPIAMETHWLASTTQGRCPLLSDGSHTISVCAQDYSETSAFVIDTKAPAITISRPAPDCKIGKKTITVQGRTEPGGRVIIENGKQISAGTTDGWGYFSIVTPAAQGKNTLNISVYDEAGNQSHTTAEFMCDTTAPELTPLLMQDDGKVKVDPKSRETTFSQNAATLSVSASDNDTGISSVVAIVDGGKPLELPLEEVEEAQPATATATSTPAQPATDAGPNSADAEAEEQVADTGDAGQNSDTPASLPFKVKASYQLPILYEGTHTVDVIATNGVGNATKRSLSCIVDSTETYGIAALGPGARGKDVEELQRRLEKRGYLAPPYVIGHFDEPTRLAVTRLQKEMGLGADGVAGPVTLGGLGQRIYVNLAQFTAKLISDDGTIYSYPVAIGIADHPTPTGEFYIAELAKHPTWLPPDAEWAKDAKVIEAGPDNPLGTRWIGLDCGSVGFHGTPYPDSVGTASSHGCMRMRIPDVEDLFERVSIGTRVRIFRGDEDDPELHAYWP